jgi:SAM-dependent methyltransferase
VDLKTLQYYDDHADEVFAQYTSTRSGVEKYFPLAFPPGSEILDVGAGSGRDLDILIRQGYAASGAEPSAQLRELALTNLPRLAGRLYAGALPDLFAQIARKFDGILCAAVFQHIPAEEQSAAALDMRNLLKPGGRLLLSFPKDRPGIDASARDSRGRLFTPLIADEVALIFEGHGFDLLSRWQDSDNLARPGVTWTTLLFSLR